MAELTEAVRIERMCSHCLFEWGEFITRDELKKLVDGEVIGPCPKCGKPT